MSDDALTGFVVGLAMVAGLVVGCLVVFALSLMWMEISYWFSIRKCPQCGNKRRNVVGKKGGVTYCICSKCKQNWAG